MTTGWIFYINLYVRIQSKINQSNGDNALLRPTGIQITTKPLPGSTKPRTSETHLSKLGTGVHHILYYVNTPNGGCSLSFDMRNQVTQKFSKHEAKTIISPQVFLKYVFKEKSERIKTNLLSPRPIRQKHCQNV